MSKESKKILKAIEQYLEKNPHIRFGQALFNLGINEFADKNNLELKGYLLRDIYNDDDLIVLNRIKIK